MLQIASFVTPNPHDLYSLCWFLFSPAIALSINWIIYLLKKIDLRTIARRGKQPKPSSMDEWINNMCGI